MSRSALEAIRYCWNRVHMAFRSFAKHLNLAAPAMHGQCLFWIPSIWSIPKLLTDAISTKWRHRQGKQCTSLAIFMLQLRCSSCLNNSCRLRDDYNACCTITAWNYSHMFTGTRLGAAYNSTIRTCFARSFDQRHLTWMFSNRPVWDYVIFMRANQIWVVL
jgi:hypothetical protein